VPKKEEPLKPESKAPASEQQGSETGSEFGVLEGMEGGVEGGMVGGVPGGVLGGVLGGTGTGPVLDYDQPPRPIKQTKPTYPQEAFIKKIEGTVVLEILIDSTGRVVRARVIQSVPQLDAAAVQTVYQWVFIPAMKHGRPVPTVALAPVNFRIF
jgi:protein TonB